MMRRIVAVVLLGEPALTDPFGAVAAAAELAGSGRAEAILLARPEDAEAAAAQAAREGAAEITLVTDSGLSDPPQPEHWLELLAGLLAEDARGMLLLLPGGAVGEELAARLTMRLDAVPLGRCGRIVEDGARLIAHRAAYGGRAELVLETGAPRCIATMRRPAAPPKPAADPVIRRADLAIPFAADAPRPEVLPAAADRPKRVDAARIVVSGGRGMGGPEGFALLRELADMLGAATGASLPAVDAGWASVSQQVGQSGAFVAPDLYLAVGMSGTPQHLAGIAPHSRIAAINSDPEADIFRVAEVGLLAPWQEVLPRLIATLRDG
ncbi:electron transfer flavoprotein subunit alpha/FixB family protein [Siccirubricoccus sp. G192]|uniref:electron transfer flavoprotein subunit alpha/FixB family protein n=1 Tax=Siccirubricoccus sp. G192 TaxID=2849651 RepID=UPI001C2C0DFA|nr:electron transfer flavoprotein subunit alpha/FixB family protein [Siccirubricoccus sp. G192]MBV1796485.1 electron transfer flavoprotein subunit alpha/FixB family protein [Siccirubricoccus sp. G192]